MADSRTYRSKFYTTNVVFLLILVAVMIVLDLWASKIRGVKMDLSEDQIYTISEATESILGKLTDDVTVTYFMSEDAGDFLRDLQRDTLDMFEEFRSISGGKFKYSIKDPDKDRDEFATKKTEAYLAARKKVTDAPEADKAAATKGLVEPKIPEDPMAKMMGRPAPTDEQRRKQREEDAEQVAVQDRRDSEEVYRELLHDEFQREFTMALSKKGVASFPWQERSASSVRQINVYSSITISHLDKTENIGRYTQLEGIEYELCRRIVKLANATKPIVAFFDPRKPPAPPMNPMQGFQPPPPGEYSGIIRYLRDLFDVREITNKENDSISDLVKQLKVRDLRKEREDAGDESEFDEAAVEVLPADYARLKCLVVAQPDQLEERQIYEINKAVSLGVKTVFLVSPYSLDVSMKHQQLTLPFDPLSSRLDELFNAWGFAVGSKFICSNDSGVIMVQQQVQGIPYPVQAPAQIPVLPAATAETINQESPITNRLRIAIFPASMGLELKDETIKANGLEATKLAETTRFSWDVEVDPMQRTQNFMLQRLGPGVSVGEYIEDMARPKDPVKDKDKFLKEKKLLALDLRGKFPFVYEGEKVPAWKKAPPPEEGGGPNPHGGGFQLPPGLMPGGGGIPGGDRDAVPQGADTSDTEASDATAATPPAASGETAATAAPAAAAPAAQEGTTPVPAEGTTPAPAEGTTPAPGAVTPTPGAVTPAPGAATPAVDISTGDEAELTTEVAKVEPVVGQIVVLSSADMMKDSFLRLSERFQMYGENVRLFHNVVELFGLDDRLSEIQRKGQTMHPFEPDSEHHVTWIRWLNLLGMPLLIALVGLARFLYRRNASVRYERQYIQKHHIG